MNFSNLLLWEGYLSLAMHHEQCNFIILAVREENEFQQLIFNKIHFYNLTSTAYSYKQGNPLPDKYMSKVISDQTKNAQFYMNLVPCSSYNHCYMWTYALSAFVSHLPVWIKNQINNWYKYSGHFVMPKIMRYASNSQCVQNLIFPNGKPFFSNSLINS